MNDRLKRKSETNVQFKKGNKKKTHIFSVAYDFSHTDFGWSNFVYYGKSR